MMDYKIAFIIGFISSFVAGYVLYMMLNKNPKAAL